MAKQFSIGKENTVRGKMLYFALRLLMPFVRLIWIKKIEGIKNLPKNGPYIIAANHQSFMDIICLMSALPEVRLTFLAAERMFNAPCLKQLMVYTGQIKVDRQAQDKTEVITAGLNALKNNKVLAIFPQGTRSRNGKIEKVYTGAARLALNAKATVVPVGIKNTYQILPHNKMAPRLKKIVEINIGPPINLTNYNDEALDMAKFYSMAADRVMRKISELSGLEFIKTANKPG